MSGKPKKNTLKKRKNKASKDKKSRNLLNHLLTGLVWVLSIGLVLFFYLIHDLPELGDLNNIKQSRKVTIIGSRDEIISVNGELHGDYITFEHIPKHLIDAVLATEDRKFFEHNGIDLSGIIRAAYVNVTKDRLAQGGSTITQQLAKNLFLSSQKTIKRKVQEMVLALYIESKLPKSKIMEIYLNRSYLGSGIYGVSGAAWYYFGKKINQINLKEAALIAGLLKAPTTYSPYNNLERAEQRANQILLNMYNFGYITEAELSRAKLPKIRLALDLKGIVRNNYFTDWVIEQADELMIPQDEDLIIRTTLDSSLQIYAQNLIEQALKKYEKQLNVKQASAVIMDHDGAIRAMIGGNNYLEAPFNRATKALRQPGSAFKIFPYIAAFEQGYELSDRFDDSKISIGKWMPNNYGKKTYGEMSLLEAFANSNNIIAVKLSEKVGIGKIVSTAKSMGISTIARATPAMALGTNETTLLELTNAYNIIANSGNYTEAYGILSISNEDGKLYFKKAPPSQKLKKIISNSAMHKINKALIESVENGTGKSARFGWQIAGKTGTSQQSRDAFFIGYSNRLTAGVWTGNDDNSPMRGVTGGKLPSWIWRDIMKFAHRDMRPEPIRIRDGRSFVERLFDLGD